MLHNRFGSFFGFLLRHGIASVISVAFPIALTIVTYLILFLVALVGGLPIGSPVALPLWVFAIFVISLMYTSLFLFPSIWFAEIISKRLAWSPFTQMFLSTVILFVQVHLVYGILQLLPDYGNAAWLQIAEQPLIASLALALPLGLYWWSAKAVEFSTWGVSSLWDWLLDHTKPEGAEA